jgi:precorrin-2 dehydrogenase / sirohydrochlorin ferrochelatase
MGLMLQVDVADRSAVVVGSGPAGREKVARLRAAGAKVVIVDPAAASGGWPDGVAVMTRAFRADDVAGAALVVAATDDAGVNEAVARAGRAAGAIVVRADRPDGGGVAFAAVLEEGPVTVGVATGGVSPRLARWLRDRIATVVTPAVGEVAEMMARRPRSEGRRRHRDLQLDEALACVEAGDMERARGLLGVTALRGSTGRRRTS